MIKRLPISLKFEDTEEFYSEFIEPKKDDRELTTFIMDLLQAYYYNDEIRQMIDSYIIDQNPYIKIHEELQKITMRHKRYANAVNMLSDYNNNELELQVNKSNTEDTQGNNSNVDESEKAELKRLLEKYGADIKKEETPPPTPEIKTEVTSPIIVQSEPPVIDLGLDVGEDTTKVPSAFKKMMGSVK